MGAGKSKHMALPGPVYVYTRIHFCLCITISMRKLEDIVQDMVLTFHLGTLGIELFLWIGLQALLPTESSYQSSQTTFHVKTAVTSLSINTERGKGHFC